MGTIDRIALVGVMVLGSLAILPDVMRQAPAVTLPVAIDRSGICSSALEALQGAVASPAATLMAALPIGAEWSLSLRRRPGRAGLSYGPRQTATWSDAGSVEGFFHGVAGHLLEEETHVSFSLQRNGSAYNWDRRISAVFSREPLPRHALGGRVQRSVQPGDEAVEVQGSDGRLAALATCRREASAHAERIAFHIWAPPVADRAHFFMRCGMDGWQAPGARRPGWHCHPSIWGGERYWEGVMVFREGSMAPAVAVLLSLRDEFVGPALPLP